MKLSTRLRDQLRFGAYAVGVKGARDLYDWPADRWEGEWKAGEWDYMGDATEMPRYALLAGLIAVGDPGTVIDVGCGTGILRSHLRDDAFTTYRGYDLSTTAVARATARDFPRTTFTVADATEEKLEPADVLVLNEVVYLVPEPSQFIARIPELVKPGGRLLVAIYRHPGDIVAWRALGQVATRLDEIRVRNENPKAPYGTRIAHYRVP